MVVKSFLWFSVVFLGGGVKGGGGSGLMSSETNGLHAPTTTSPEELRARQQSRHRLRSPINTRRLLKEPPRPTSTCITMGPWGQSPLLGALPLWMCFGRVGESTNCRFDPINMSVFYVPVHTEVYRTFVQRADPPVETLQLFSPHLPVKSGSCSHEWRVQSL